MDEYGGKQFVGIDLHRRRSVMVRQSESGEQLSAVRQRSSRAGTAARTGRRRSRGGAGSHLRLVPGGRRAARWWSAGAFGASVGGQRVSIPPGENDVRDAADLADLLRMGRLPEAWIAPPQTRDLREVVRYRAKLIAIQSGLQAQIHAVLAKAGVLVAVSDLFGGTGRQRLAKVPVGVGPRRTNPLAAATHRHSRQPRNAVRRDDGRTAGHPHWL